MAASPGFSASNVELEKRIKVLEEQNGKGENKWFDMITLSGAVEVETVFEDSKLDGDSSDISLATAEINGIRGAAYRPMMTTSPAVYGKLI